MTLHDLLFEDCQSALREAIGRAPRGKRREREALQRALTTAELLRERDECKK